MIRVLVKILATTVGLYLSGAVALASQVGDNGTLSGRSSIALASAYRAWSSSGTGSDFHVAITEQTDSTIIRFERGAGPSATYTSALAVDKSGSSVEPAPSLAASGKTTLLDGDIARAVMSAASFIDASTSVPSEMRAAAKSGAFVATYLRRNAYVLVNYSFVLPRAKNAIDGCLGKSFEVSESDFSVREVKAACQ